jgi:dUTP pyrophosphatase
MVYWPHMTAVLSKSDIRRLMTDQPPLIEGCVDIEQQLQPNGIDLTVRDIAALQTAGTIAVNNARRSLSGLTILNYDAEGCIYLPPAAYVITYNEIVHLPNHVMALARPRSSLLRCGVTVETAVWDAGYSGRSQSLLLVYNPSGFRLERNTRIVQLVFFLLTEETEAYRGIYQGENIQPRPLPSAPLG